MSVHLEKVLKHAEQKLMLSAKKSPTDMLDLYRNFLKIEEHRLLIEHQAGTYGVDLAAKRATMIDVVLRHIWKGAINSLPLAHSIPFEEDYLALLAVGGYGRAELCPYSDIDLLFLYGDATKDPKVKKLVDDVVQQVLYVLWDVGLKIGHASRTLDELVNQCNEDLQTKTAMLEARLLCGPESLFAAFEARFEKGCIKGREKEYLKWRHDDQNARHKKFGDTVFMQEPNVKNGCGGLRDYQNLLWVARFSKGLRSTSELIEHGWITAAERKKIDRAYDFLLHIRTQLHYIQKRPGDVLTLKLQGNVSNAFRYPQKHILRRTETLMRDYYQAARDAFHITDLVARRLSGDMPSSKSRIWSFLPVKFTKRIKVDGFHVEDHEIDAEERSVFSNAPQRLVRVFHLMQQYDAVLSPELESLVRSKIGMASRRLLWIPEVREMMNDILRKKGKVGRITRAMHETGILGRLIPEFEPLTCLVQHEFFHLYTADEHTLVCVEQLDKVIDCSEMPYCKYHDLFVDCEHPEILYMALILHDTGKSEHTRNHSDASAQLAARFARRMKIHSRQLQNLVFLVDHHMTLSKFAQHRNLEDPNTIREFARIVQDQERLDMLMLLTFADGQGTGSNKNWSGWKELLVWNLYRRTSDMLKGEQEFLRRIEIEREATVERVRKLLDKSIGEGEVGAHIQTLPERYLMCASDKLIAEHIKLVHDFFIMFHQGDNILRPAVKWIEHVLEGHSEVVVVTWDRDRLFSKIAGAFAVAELNILSADAFTRSDNIVIDTFRVCTSNFEAVTNKIDRKTFEESIAQSLSEEDYDFSPEILKLRKKRKPVLEGAEIPTVLEIDNESSDECSLLYVQTQDRIGLLYDVTNCLAGFEMVIQHSRISTEKGAALDTFYITDKNDKKIVDPEQKKNLIEALKQIISPLPEAEVV